MVSGKPPNTVERKIYFFRWRVYVDNDGDPPFDPRKAAELIGQLGFLDRSRYLELEDGNDLCVWPVTPVRLRMGVVRRSGLPRLEESGNISPLPIAENQGLLEEIHVVFFPNNIVGAEFNFYGPRVSRLATYLREKFPNELPPVGFEMLLRQDVQEQLDHMREVRLVQLRMHSSHVNLAQQADQSLFQALDAAREASQATSVELVLKPQRYSRQNLGQRALNWVKLLASTDGIREAAEVFKVKALDDRTQKYELFDLLRDQLVMSRYVERLPGRDRGVDSNAMFSAVEEAHENLRESLERAAGVGT